MSGTPRTPAVDTDGETEEVQQKAIGDDLNVFDLDFNHNSFYLAETQDPDSDSASDQTPLTWTNKSDSASESESALSFERESNNGEGEGLHWSDASTTASPMEEQTPTTMEPYIMVPILGSAFRIIWDPGAPTCAITLAYHGKAKLKMQHATSIEREQL